MLRASPYATNALPYGLLGRLFSTPVKAAVQNARQISQLFEYQSVAVRGADLMKFVHAVEWNPPVVTIYRLGDAQASSQGVAYVSPTAPLFDISI